MNRSFYPIAFIVGFSSFSGVYGSWAVADVRFAAPNDPIVKALYPMRDTLSGFTPEEAPLGVEKSNSLKPRTVNKECAGGFKIAENVTKAWNVDGKKLFLTAFFTTTDNPPQGHAPCYDPRLWVCVLSKEGPDYKPTSCSSVEQEITFPGNPSLDTANYRLNDRERAFGLRVSHESGNAQWLEEPEALVLFRLSEKKLGQILALEIGRKETHYDDEKASCRSKFVLDVLTTRTNGFFDWLIRLDKKSKHPCPTEVESAGTYRWSGSRYVRAVPKK